MAAVTLNEREEESLTFVNTPADFISSLLSSPLSLCLPFSFRCVHCLLECSKRHSWTKSTFAPSLHKIAPHSLSLSLSLSLSFFLCASVIDETGERDVKRERERRSRNWRTNARLAFNLSLFLSLLLVRLLWPPVATEIAPRVASVTGRVWFQVICSCIIQEEARRKTRVRESTYKRHTK